MLRVSAVIWRLCVAALVMIVIACADSAPTTPFVHGASHQASARAESNGNISITGRATVEVRRFGGGLLGTVLQRDSGAYKATMRGDGDVSGKVVLSSGTLSLAALESSKRVAIRGKGAKAVKLKSGRVVRLTSTGDGSVEELEVSEGGQVTSRIAREWERAGSVWRLARMTQTYFEENRPAFSIMIVLDPGDAVESAAVTNSPVAGVGKVRPDQAAMTGDDGTVCEAELLGLQSAEESYRQTCLSFAACLGGPLACLGAYIAITNAGLKVFDAGRRLELCVYNAGGEM